MLSNRLYILLFLSFNIGCKCGSFAIKFDQKHLTFYHSTEIQDTHRVYRNTSMSIVWLLFAIWFTVKESLYGDSKFTLKLLYTICLLIVVMAYLVMHTFLQDLTSLLNSSFIYFRYVHSKFKKQIYTFIYIINLLYISYHLCF